MHHPTDRITHTTAFVTPVVEHWLEREIAQWVHTMKDRFRRPIAPRAYALPLSYVPLHTIQSYEQDGNENKPMSKHTQPNTSETDCDVVHCGVRNKHWKFDPRLTDIVNQFVHFPIWQH